MSRQVSVGSGQSVDALPEVTSGSDRGSTGGGREHGAPDCRWQWSEWEKAGRCAYENRLGQQDFLGQEGRARMAGQARAEGRTSQRVKGARGSQGLL